MDPITVNVTTADSTNFPSPSGLKTTNISGPDVLTGDPTQYPIAQWANFTFWPLSFIDNRVAYAIATTVTINGSITILKLLEAQGSRYIWEIQVDQNNQKVNFIGQSSQTASVSFADLGVFN